MEAQRLEIDGIPALIWGRASDKVYVHVHGKMSCKEFAKDFAVIAGEKGYQTLSFDLPEHGERSGDQEYPCDIWNGPRDLKTIAEYAFTHWKAVSLCAGSLGAFFSLHAYRELPFQKCLFQSPIVDMEFLVHRMMDEFGVTEAELREKGVIQCFTERYSCDLTIAPGKEHAFMGEGDSQLVQNWYRDKI